MGKMRHNLVIFGLTLLAFFTTSTTLDYHNFLLERHLTTLWASLWLVGQWFITLAVVLDASIKIAFYRALGWLRRRPHLLWLIILVAAPSTLMTFELLRNEGPLPSEYLAWNLLWLSFILFILGSRDEDWQFAARRLGHSWLSGPMISLSVIVALMIGAELALRHVIIFSNGFAAGLVHTEWVYRYWNPLNELTFRDYPIYRPKPDDARRLMVLGDSFAAGLGVNHIDHTFPHLLARQLGEDYHLHVVAHAGWNTDLQVEGIIKYPFNPDLLIYSYFLNDASYVSPTINYAFHEIFAPPEPPLFDIVARFYLADFLYWNVYTQWLRGARTSYGDLVLDVYQDPLLWERHLADVQSILSWAQDEQQVPVVVILWPVLTQIEESEPAMQKLQQFFESQRVIVVNMSEHVADVPISQRIVNPFDMHPSEWAHAVAAEKLFEALQENRLLPPSTNSDDVTSTD